MRISQILAEAPSDCPRVSIQADVFYGSPRIYRLRGYKYGEIGAITKVVQFTAQADQTEFTEREFDRAMQDAGFHMPARPARNAGFQYTYELRPVPTTQAEPPPAFSFNIKSGSLGYAEEKAREERLLARFEQQMLENAAAPAAAPDPAPTAGKLVRLVVAGSREVNGKEFADLAFVTAKLDAVCARLTGPIIVISGTARGADRLGEQWAAARGYPVERFPADWEHLGRQAGRIRNQRLIDQATHACFFWDGQSVGTKHAIECARQRGIPVRIWTIQ